MPRSTHLTKSKYISGLRCPRKLWLDVHQPLPFEPSPLGSPADIGTRVGLKAHALVPGGVAVETPLWKHAEGRARTDALIADAAVPGIFEAVLAYDDIRVHVDVLERDGDGWCLGEVKASTAVKDTHLDDIAVQVYVARGMGLDIRRAELVHIDTAYVRGEGDIDWAEYFARTDVTAEVEARLPGLPARIDVQKAVLAQPAAPEIAPDRWRCLSPYPCDHWAACTASKPASWINGLYRISKAQFDRLTAAGIERIEDAPDRALNARQILIRDVMLSGTPHVSPDLTRDLAAYGPPCFHLDFETLGAAIPPYPGTHPYQRIPFQWSVHHLDADGSLTHWEYLAEGRADPRRELAETLVSVLGGSDTPVIVYNQSFEIGVLRELQALLPDLADALRGIEGRVKDLYRLTCDHTYFPGYENSYSLKTVGPTLAPEVDYASLDGVAGGQDAAATFARIVLDMLEPEEDEAEIRDSLRAYCKLDTLATVRAQQKLMDLV
jgi:hypothetical protein